MTLVAEILAFLVSHVTVGAVQLILVMRGEMGIGGLDVLRLRHERLHVVTGRAGFRRRFLQILLVRPVADGALQSFGDMLVRKRCGLGRGHGGKARQKRYQSVFHKLGFRSR